jgi:hypothetical protein
MKATMCAAPISAAEMTTTSPDHDPDHDADLIEIAEAHLLQHAGWVPEELYWEELSAEGLRLTATAEAHAYWREAATVAAEVFSAIDPRRAASEANLSIAAFREGQRDEAMRLLAAARERWAGIGPWLADLKPRRAARSSLFHLRLERKHPGGYAHWERARHAALAKEGEVLLATSPDDEAMAQTRVNSAARWLEDRGGFSDYRRLLSAVRLIAF